MGKYMRKCRAAAAGGGKAAPAVVEHRAPVALGVRTRSRAAALDAKMRKQQATTSTAARAVEDALLGRDGGDAAAGCYLHLRSRRLFMPASAVVDRLRGQGADEEASTAGLAGSGPSMEAGVVAGVSRCSSTASTAAEVSVAARKRGGDEAEQASERRDVESSVSDSECGGRDRRETTPSSRSPADLSDLESSQAADEQKHKRRRHPVATTTTAAPFRLDLEARARMPPVAEIDEFFAPAEKEQAERFAAKYNFDVARGVPLNAGRFEWTPVATV